MNPFGLHWGLGARVCAGALAAALLILPQGAAAAWPERPVTVIVPYAAGGNTDIMARLASDELSRVLGQPFVVENRGGAGGALGAQAVARATPDGYTLLFGTTAQLSILPHMQSVHYDPIKDFAPIAVFGSSFSILGIHKSVPATDFESFVAYAKAHPNSINYASGGVGTVAHLVSALFAKRAGLDMVHVPYKGGSQAVTDLLAGQVQMYFGNSSELLPYKDGPDIKLLAVGTPERATQLPAVPTVAEFYPGFSLPSWNGFVAPAGTPDAVVALLSERVHAAAQKETIATRLRDLGIRPGTATAGELARIIVDEQTIYEAAVGAAGIAQQ